jgi:hypothetical protein
MRWKEVLKRGRREKSDGDDYSQSKTKTKDRNKGRK